MQVGWRAVADLRGHELQSRGTLTTANTRIFWPWRPHLKTGKQCKTLVDSYFSRSSSPMT